MHPTQEETPLDAPIDFSLVLAEQQVLFDLLGLTEKSERVQAWLAKTGKKALYDLDFDEYKKLCKALQNAWAKEQDYIAPLRNRADRLLATLGIDWQNPILIAFQQTEAVQRDGLTPHLERLCEALQTEINGADDHDRPTFPTP